jgi:lysophospholipase L1-like esterase
MKNRIAVLGFFMLTSAFVFGQVARVTYSPFKHYSDKVEDFRQQREIDSTSIVMLGNSLTEYAGNWSKLVGVKHIVNRGIAGDDAMGIYNRLSQILPGHPKAIFLMIGINDLSHDLTSLQVVDLVQKVIKKIRHDSPKTRLYIQSLLPINESFGVWKTLDGKSSSIPVINRMLQQYASHHKIEFINLYPNFVRHGTLVMRKEMTIDGLHLTPFGYKVWAFEVRKYMKTL